MSGLRRQFAAEYRRLAEKARKNGHHDTAAQYDAIAERYECNF